LVSLAAGAALFALQDGAGFPVPSEQHELLHKSIGHWTAAIDAGGEPMPGKMVVREGPGGFTVTSMFEADMGGMAFTGQGIDGYDPHKKKYVSVWIDSMAEAPLIMEGTWDEKSQTMTMHGDSVDMSTGKVARHKFVTKWVDADTMQFDIFAPGADGKDVRSMGIKYTRNK
jgi:hypothetical protein